MKNGLTEEQIEQMKLVGCKFYESPEERFRFLMTLMKIEEMVKHVRAIPKS